jgi:heme-degrading monooxygenase HmoA
LILRIVRGDVAPGGLDPLVGGFVDGYAPAARVTPGLIRYHVGVGPGEAASQVVVVTFWTSVDAALAAYGGDLDRPRTLDGLSDNVVLREVAYWEVDETLLRRSERSPSLLRLSFGRVSEGADAAIQEEIRQRMHLLEPEMTEGYIGRRLLGAEVEIAFVSAWSRTPAGRDLAAPVWPDVAARYTTFGLEIYRPIVSGTPADGPEPSREGGG